MTMSDIRKYLQRKFHESVFFKGKRMGCKVFLLFKKSYIHILYLELHYHTQELYTMCFVYMSMSTAVCTHLHLYF